MLLHHKRFAKFLLLTASLLVARDLRCSAFSVQRKTLRFPRGRKLIERTQAASDDTGLDLVPIQPEGPPKQAKRQGEVSLWRQMCAETIGTFIIVQMGTGAIMSAIFDNALAGLFQIASVWIIAVTVAISTTGSISGAHLNPAMSIAFATVRRNASFGLGKLLAYIGSQLVGAIGGSLCNLALYHKKILQFEAEKGIIRGSVESIVSAKAFGEYFSYPITTATAFCVEAFGTGVLAFVVFSLTNPKNDAETNNVPLLIGLTVGALIAGLAPLTQAGMNPARDFGPRIVAYFAGWKRIAFQGWWVYVVAPVFGAITGGIVADKLYGVGKAETP